MEFIITCQLSVVPVRIRPDETSEMVTQILYGEKVRILEQQERWLEIEMIHDAYQGWVDRKMLDISNSIEHGTETKIVQSLLYKHENSIGTQILSFGSYIRTKTLHPDLLNKPLNIEDLSIKAKQFLEVPYLWGGRTCFGIDCSGFVQILYRLAAIDLKRDASEQIKQGREIASLKMAQSGDLAFFGKKNKITHVGMILNQKTIIHASGKVRIDGIDDRGIYHEESKIYTHHLKMLRTFR